MKPCYKFFRKGWVLAILSGGLTALSLPGFELDFLAWICLVPLLFALEGGNWKRDFPLSFLGGLVFFGTFLSWIFTLREWAGLFILPAYLLLIAYLSLYWGAFGLLYSFFKKRFSPITLTFAVPALWVLLEFARSLGKFGFTWGDLSYSLYRRTVLTQISSITGIWGVSFAIVLVNHLIFRGIKCREWKPLLGAMLTVILLLSFGTVVEMGDRLSEGKELRIAVVQPNIPQRRKTDSRNLEFLLDKYAGMLGDIKVNEVDLVILPESILPGYVLRQEDLRETFAEFARENGVYLLFGTIDYREGHYYNSTVLLSSQGGLIAQYDKVQLVPFSPEYVPFRKALAALGFGGLIQELAPVDLTPGGGYTPLESGLGRVGTPICFESTFPQIARDFVRNGAELLATLTNDAWFKNSFALPQHFAQGAFRAIENRRFFVQSANTGISGIISPYGKIIRSSSIQEEEILYGTVYLSDKRTLYNRYGDWFACCATAYILAMLLASIMLRLLHQRSIKTSSAGVTLWLPVVVSCVKFDPLGFTFQI